MLSPHLTLALTRQCLVLLAWLCLAALLGVARAADIGISIIAARGLEDQAALLSVPLTQLAGVQLHERQALDAVFAERELDATTLTQRLPGVDALLFLESATLGTTPALVMRLVDTRSTVVLATLVTPQAQPDADWPQRVADTVSAQLNRIKTGKGELVAMTLLALRPRYEATAVRHLAQQPQMTPLLAARLAQVPGIALLDRSRLADSELERQLHSLTHASLWRSSHSLEGEYWREADRWHARLMLSTPGKATQELRTGPHATVTALIDAAAKVIAAAATPSATLPTWALSTEASALAREAEWLWRTGQREAALPLAAAACELDGHAPNTQVMRFATLWMQAWPHLIDVTLPRASRRFELVVKKEATNQQLLRLPAELAARGIAIAPLRADASLLSGQLPSAAQFTAIADALDHWRDLITVDAARSATEPPAQELWWSTGTRPNEQADLAAQLCHITFAIAAAVLEAHYLHGAKDGPTADAARRLRQQMRDMLKLKSELWHHAYPGNDADASSPTSLWSIVCAETLNDSVNALRAVLTEVPSLEQLSQRAQGRAQRLANLAPVAADTLRWRALSNQWAALAGWCGRVCENDPSFSRTSTHVFDWQQQDRATALAQQDGLASTLDTRNSPFHHQLGASYLRFIQTQDKSAKTLALREYLEMIIASPAVLDDRAAATAWLLPRTAELLILDLAHGYSAEDTRSGHAALMQAWMKLHALLCDRAPSTSTLSTNLGALAAKLEPEGRTIAPQLFADLQRYVQRRVPRGPWLDMSGWSPEQIAKEVHYTLPAHGIAPGTVLGPALEEVLALKPIIWSPYPRAESEDDLVDLSATTVVGDQVFTVPLYDADSTRRPALHVLNVATLKESQQHPLWPLGVTMKSLLIPMALHVENGIAHVAAGRAFRSIDVKTGATLFDYESQDLRYLRSAWCDGSWFGFTTKRDNIDGSLFAQIPLRPGNYRAIADSVRRPVQTRWDERKLRDVWPIVPVKPGVVCAWMDGIYPELWSSETGQHLGSLHEATAKPQRSLNYDFRASVSRTPQWTTVAMQSRPQLFNPVVIAFDRKGGAPRLLLNDGSTTRRELLGQPMPQPSFDQPPHPDSSWRSIGSGVTAGSVWYDGEHLYLISHWQKNTSELLLWHWRNGQRQAEVRCIAFPSITALYYRDRAPQRSSTMSVNTPVFINGIWPTQHGLVLLASSETTSIDALFLVPWEQVKLPAYWPK